MGWSPCRQGISMKIDAPIVGQDGILRAVWQRRSGRVTNQPKLGGAGNLACSRLSGGSLGFGHSCGRQSCLQAAFQAAISTDDESLGLGCGMSAKHEAGEIPGNCVSGLYDGGLKGRLQAGLPATQGGRLHAANSQSRGSRLSGGSRTWTDQP